MEEGKNNGQLVKFRLGSTRDNNKKKQDKTRTVHEPWPRTRVPIFFYQGRKNTNQTLFESFQL